MNFTTPTQDRQAKYNSFVAAHPRGSFLQSWEWGNWQAQLGHVPTRVLIKSEGGHILLSAQILKVSIPRLGWHYLYIPYGPLVSPELLPEQRQEALAFLAKELKQRFSHSLCLRLEPVEEPGLTGKPTVHIQPGKTLIIDLRQSQEQLLRAMHPKTRYNIKVAQRHGVDIISELLITPGHGLYLEDTVRLLVNTAARQNYKSHGALYYRTLIDFFSRQSETACRLSVYRAVLHKKLLACGLMIDFGTTRTYLFGGTSSEQRNAMAPYLMHWQAMQDATRHGLNKYNFWGIETAQGQTPGFVRFKLGWGGETVAYPSATDIIHQPLWYNLYAALRKIHRKV